MALPHSPQEKELTASRPCAKMSKLEPIEHHNNTGMVIATLTWFREGYCYFQGDPGSPESSILIESTPMDIESMRNHQKI